MPITTLIGDPAFDPTQGPAVLLFDGDAPACLAALRLGRVRGRVHLLACRDRGTQGLAAVREHVQRLNRHYADPGRFSLDSVDVDALLFALRRAVPPPHKHLAVSFREPSAVARLAAALALSKRVGATAAGDGAQSSRAPAVGHDPVVRGEVIEPFARTRGVTWLAPVADVTGDVEAPLWAERYARAAKVRDTPLDRRLSSDWTALQGLAERAPDPFAADVRPRWFRAMLEHVAGLETTNRLDALLRWEAP